MRESAEMIGKSMCTAPSLERTVSLTMADRL